MRGLKRDMKSFKNKFDNWIRGGHTNYLQELLYNPKKFQV